MASKNYINRLIDGDARAFDEIYFAYKSLFIAVLRKEYGHDMEHAVDLYHRVYIRKPIFLVLSILSYD